MIIRNVCKYTLYSSEKYVALETVGSMRKKNTEKVHPSIKLEGTLETQ